MNEKLDCVQELEDRIEKRITAFRMVIDILSGRITELEAKLNETQGLLYTTRRELEGRSPNFINSVIADIPVRLQRLEKFRANIDEILAHPAITDMPSRLKALEDFRAEAEKVHIQLKAISMPNKDSILKRMANEQ